MKYDILWTTQFKRDYKTAMKRNLPIARLDNVIRLLAAGEKLPPEYRDHALANNWRGFRECHIQPDWLLIYKQDNGQLILTLARTGSHTELLDKKK